MRKNEEKPNSLTIEYKNEKTSNVKSDLSSRMLNVFQNHNKPIPEILLKPPVIQNTGTSILSEYLFKENTKKELRIDQKMEAEETKKEKASSKISHPKLKQKNKEQEEDEKFQQIRAERQSGRNYMSTISTRFNPDLLIGESLGTLNR